MEEKNDAHLIFLKELEAEAPATRKCLERIPMELSAWKPHEKSMQMGYLALLVAEIPLWVKVIIETGVIDFATWKHVQPASTADLVQYFDENTRGSMEALRNTTDGKLAELFHLRRGEQVFMSMPKVDTIAQTINHLVHHRGQLSVYMRLNNIPVPSIYGPSADDKTF